MTTTKEDSYLQYAELMTELSNEEIKLSNLKRTIEDLKAELDNPDSDGSFGLEISAHAYKQLSERLYALTLESSTIKNDVFKENQIEGLLLPNNLKCFIITLLADAKKKGNYTKEKSKNSANGYEFRYTINMTKWSNNKNLQLICIIECSNIKTGYFNWV